MFQFKNINGDTFFFSQCQDFDQLRALFFNRKTTFALWEWYQMNFKIRRTWLAFESVIAFINLTAALPIRDLISGILANSYLHHEQTVREFATLLKTESTSLARTQRFDSYINEGLTSSESNQSKYRVLVLNSLLGGAGTKRYCT